MSKIFLFFCLISLIYSKGPYKIENDVLVLTEKTFGHALREFKNLLVLFYDPGCPHCQEFLPNYHKIASLLKNENFVLAKLDCIKYEKIEVKVIQKIKKGINQIKNIMILIIYI